MPFIKVEVPEGEGCGNCPCSKLINIWKFDLYCKQFKVRVGTRNEEKKCPACIEAIKAVGK